MAARLQIRYKPMDVLLLLCFMVRERIKGTLACVWNEGERFYTPDPVLEWCEWFS